MQARALVLCSMVGFLGACVTETVPCSSASTDPLCQPDVGVMDTGTRDSGPGVDAGDGGVGDDTSAPCGGCSGAMSMCLVATGECVECLDDEACGASGRCAPDTHACVPCLGTPGDTCPAATPLCDATARTCVACLTNDDCTDPTASVCSATHTCEPCDAAGECTHLTGTPTCDTTAMRCVGCTATERAGCASDVCLLATSTCAAPGGATPTCGACVRDAECRAGQVCAPMTYDDPTTPAADPLPAGNHCLWRQDAAGTGAPNGDCNTIRPYVRSSAVTSVDGSSTTACTLAVSTCAAQAAYRSTDCLETGPAGDARCGDPALHDGVCRMSGPTTYRCTPFCLGDDDCRSSVACSSDSPGTCVL